MHVGFYECIGNSVRHYVNPQRVPLISPKPLLIFVITSDDLHMSTIKLATDGSNWVTYQDQMIWAFNLRGCSDYLTTSTIPAAYISAGNINDQSPDQRWATEEAITKNLIA